MVSGGKSKEKVSGKSMVLEGKSGLRAKERGHVLKSDVCATIVAHDPGPYSNGHGRMLSPKEVMRLQGFDPAALRIPQLTPTQMVGLLGNAMHCGVLTRVLGKLLRIQPLES